MNRHEKLRRFEDRWATLVQQKQKGDLIRFADVPWPVKARSTETKTQRKSDAVEKSKVENTCEEEDFDEELFTVAEIVEGSDQKKILKIAQLRWHPDKFEQSFGGHLHPEDKQLILFRVTAVSKFLNLLLSRY